MTLTWEALRTELAARPADDVHPVVIDDETAAAAREAIRGAYADLVALVAPRILARLRSAQGLVAVGGPGEQLFTDAEWAEATQPVEDVLGDSVLDGAVAGATTFASIPPNIADVVAAVFKGLREFASSMRANVENWITNHLGEAVTGDWGIGAVIDALTKSSPLSQSTADTVANWQLHASNNAGVYAALDAAQVAALRWVTQRDERVRPAHVAVDKDTVPFGEVFVVGGYPARFPGDPDLPIGLRINCRCTLAYVEGTDTRRVLGSTKAELRVKASALSINGRGAMSKAELQTAVLKELCLQGLAGGPDCPDRFDDMNRTTLLTVARGEGIVGRHAMSRAQLASALRQTVRGGDTALVARGYSSRAEFAAAQHKASYKRGRAPVPGEFASTTVPSPEARRAKRPELYDEFGGQARGHVTCVHCGLRLGHEASSGLAMLVPEPIVPWSQGGGLSLDNLLPSCPSCFRARGGRGLVASAGATWVCTTCETFTHEGAIKAWDSRGRGDAPDDLVEVHTTNGPMMVPAKFVGEQQGTFDGHPDYPVDWQGWKDETDAKSAAVVARIKADQQPASAAERRSLGIYQSAFGTFREINDGLRAGTELDERTAGNVANLDSLIGRSALSEATTLHRGVQFADAKAQRAFMAAVVPGAALVDRAYMSTTTDDVTASQFAGHGKRPAMNLTIEAPAGTNFVYLGDDEHELLLPRDTQLRVRSVSPAASASRFDVWDVVADVVPEAGDDA